jgi:hypothetical protein
MELDPPPRLDRGDDRAARVDRARGVSARSGRTTRRREVDEHGCEREEGGHGEEIGKRDSSF